VKYFKRSQIDKEGLIDVNSAKVFPEKRMRCAIIFLPIPKGESSQNIKNDFIYSFAYRFNPWEYRP